MLPHSFARSSSTLDPVVAAHGTHVPGVCFTRAGS